MLSLTVQCFDDRRGDIEQGFEEVDHGNLWGVGGIQATAPADTPHAGHEPGLSVVVLLGSGVIHFVRAHVELQAGATNVHGE